MSIYRGLRSELYEWAAFILTNIPGHTGVWLRNKTVKRMFGFGGKDYRIKPGLKVTYRDKLSTGNRIVIAERVIIWAEGGVTLGNDVLIGPDAKIYSSRHAFADPDTPILDQGGIMEKIVIEDDVWVGAGASILLGVTIGKGAVISAGSVISRSIPPYAIAAGNPGRVIGWRRPPEKGANATSSDGPNVTDVPSPEKASAMLMRSQDDLR